MKLFNTFLKPSESVAASVATMALVYATYQGALPGLAEVHATDPHNGNVDAGRKKAMWTSLGVVSGVFLLTRDVNTFVAGGLAFLALEWSYRHANATHPGTGKLVPATAVDMLNQGYNMTEGVADTSGGYSGEYYG